MHKLTLSRPSFAVALALVFAFGGSTLGAATASGKSRNFVLRANGQPLHGLRGGEPGSGSPLSASVSNFALSPNSASCSSGTMEGELESTPRNHPKTYGASMFGGFGPTACDGVVVEVELEHISLKSNGSARLSGAVEVVHSNGDCAYRSKKVRGSFPVNEGAGETPLALTITSQSLKLEHRSPTFCEPTALLSGAFTLSSGGYPVIAVLE